MKLSAEELAEWREIAPNSRLLATIDALSAEVFDLQAELGVWKVQAVNEAERSQREIERLRAERCADCRAECHHAEAQP